MGRKSEKGWKTFRLVKGRLIAVDKEEKQFTYEIEHPDPQTDYKTTFTESYTRGISDEFSEDNFEELVESLDNEFTFKLRDGKLVEYY